MNDLLKNFPATPGRCYEDSARLLLEGWVDAGAMLCHGVPRLTKPAGGKPAGTRFGHAWVELEGMVYDHLSLDNPPIPRELYYRIGDLEERHIRRYTIPAANRQLLLQQQWGPWDRALDAFEG